MSSSVRDLELISDNDDQIILCTYKLIDPAHTTDFKFPNVLTLTPSFRADPSHKDCTSAKDTHYS